MFKRFLPFFAVLPGLGVFTYFWALTTASNGSIFAPGFIENPDALVRLERIRQWLASDSWYGDILTRVGESDHLVLHWTRPLDILVGAYAKVVEPFIPAADILLMAAVSFSLVSGLAALILAAQLPRIVGERRPLMIGITAVFVALLPFFFFNFTASGSPDHHGLMLIAFLACLLLGHAALTDERPHLAWALGFGQAFALWISAESLVTIVALQTGFALVWLVGLQADVPRTSLHAATAMITGLVVALMIEYGWAVPGLALDRLSGFSLLVAGGIFVVWLAAHLLQPRTRTLFQRLSILAGAALVVGVGIIAIVPQALHGPMAEADPWFVKVWTGTFRDGFNLHIHGGLVLCALALACAIALVRQRRLMVAATYLTPFIAIFALLSVISSQRWMSYSELNAIPLVILGFSVFWDRLAERGDGKWLYARTALAASLLGGAVLDTVASYNIWPKLSSPIDSERAAIGRQRCGMDDLIARLKTIEHAKGPQLVLAHANITPTILVHTGHRVTSVPIHPDAEAVHQSVKTFLSTEMAYNNAVPADLVVVCPVGHEYIAYQGTSQTLHARLSRNETVQGLALLSDAGAQGYKIYIPSSRSVPITPETTRR